MAVETVALVEVGPRDGLQNEKTLVPTADKVEFIARSVRAGIKRVEAASFVNPDRTPQMADAEAVMAALNRDDPIAGKTRRSGASYIGLALNRRGFERAIAAGCDEVGFVVVASDAFSRRNQGMGTEDGIRLWRELAVAAAERGVKASVMVAAACGCPFEGEVPQARVLEIARRLMGPPMIELAIADTIGAGTPWQVRGLIEGLRPIVGATPIRAHFHNTRNTGIANIMAAVEAGAAIVDASTGGIGGCPFAPKATGNVATEDVLYLLHHSGVRTGVVLDQVIETAHWLEQILGRTVPGLVSKAGDFPAGALRDAA